MGDSSKLIQKVVFDTGSDFLTIKTQDCTSCPSTEIYDYTTSTVYVQISTDSETHVYPSQTVEGY